jgi:hypothetical protein
MDAGIMLPTPMDIDAHFFMPGFFAPYKAFGE